MSWASMLVVVVMATGALLAKGQNNPPVKRIFGSMELYQIKNIKNIEVDDGDYLWLENGTLDNSCRGVCLATLLEEYS